MRLVVLMPTLNAQTFLVEAVESILCQEEPAFSLVVLDGGSTDCTLPILAALRNLDGRISVEVSPGRSPTERINLWLRHGDADFVAMAHADDVSASGRLAQQRAFMQANADVVIAGGATHFWLHEKRNLPPSEDIRAGEAGRQSLLAMDGAASPRAYSGFHFYPEAHEAILCRLPFWWCFSIPSLMINLGLLKRAGVLFDETLDCCSDWWFYWQARRAGRLANMDRPLISYRHHSGSHGGQSRPQIARESAIIRERIARESGFWDALADAGRAAFLAFRVEADRPSGIGEAGATLAMLDRLDAWAAGRADGTAFQAMIADYRQVVAGMLPADAGQTKAAVPP